MKNKFIFLLVLPFVLCFNFNDSNPPNREKQWYEFHPKNNYDTKSLIGLEDWNSEPAGKYGWIERKEDKLFYNGTELKLWGINNTYSACAPEREMAEKRAAFYRKFGFNSIRLHKYADSDGWGGIQSKNSFVEFDEKGLDKMDYYIKQLKENGLFVKFSPNFGVKFGPADTVHIPYYSEMGEFKENKRIRATYGAIYLSTELQNMQIDQMKNLLNHKNPYTNLKYADDPAIFCVEIFNEDAVLWYGANWSLQRYPTLRERTGKKFSNWLLEKYGNEENWKKAWGEKAILSNVTEISNTPLKHIIEKEKVEGDLTDESISDGTAIPWGNASSYDNIALKNSDYPELKQRLLDAAEFLIGLQNEFYSRYVMEIRKTGYKGEIIGSNWQAGSTIGHLLNLHSDYMVGIVDRHNYFGGGRNAFKKKTPFKDGSLLARPGIGNLSVGLQQVEGRPFMLSEWIHVQPNEYYAEGPAVLGAYGWGLNGWDVSFLFQNRDNGGFSEKLGLHEWDVANPAVLIPCAAVARQVRRFDVQESKETKTLNVHIPSVKKGKLGFIGSTEQNHDVKTFTTDKIPSSALAATRICINFTEDYIETPSFDLTPYLENNSVVSSTKELRWTPAPEGETKGGYFLLNTAATKAFVGFAPGNKTFDLGDGFSITPDKGFSVIYLTAKGENEKLASASEIVITAMARVRNTGMKLKETENQVVEQGDAPLLLEPVKAEISTPYKGVLNVLDHDGGKVVSNRKFKNQLIIDGEMDKTPFYLITK